MSAMRARTPVSLCSQPMADAVAGIDRVGNALRELAPLLAAVDRPVELRDALDRLHALTRHINRLRGSVARREAGLPDETDGGAA